MSKDATEDISGLRRPVEINDSLARFQKEYPEQKRLGFIIMKFSETPAHRRIQLSIKSTLNSYQLQGFRSDDRQYHDDLFHNIETYMHGTNFGIAVFDFIEEEEFNPNVSLEVGYMLALGKPVCLLKDRNLHTMQADLLGRLYKEFDPQDPENTIPQQLTKWLDDHGLGTAPKESVEYDLTFLAPGNPENYELIPEKDYPPGITEEIEAIKKKYTVVGRPFVWRSKKDGTITMRYDYI